MKKSTTVILIAAALVLALSVGFIYVSNSSVVNEVRRVAGGLTTEVKTDSTETQEDASLNSAFDAAELPDNFDDILL